jgi:hypothetical protein
LKTIAKILHACTFHKFLLSIVFIYLLYLRVKGTVTRDFRPLIISSINPTQGPDSRPNAVSTSLQHLWSLEFFRFIDPAQKTRLCWTLKFTNVAHAWGLDWTVLRNRSDIFRIENPRVWQIPMFSQIFTSRNLARFWAKRL